MSGTFAKRRPNNAIHLTSKTMRASDGEALGGVMRSIDRRATMKQMKSTTFEDARIAKVNGMTFAFREQGEGEPVVFVHGGISDLRTWQYQLAPIGASFRAIAYSRRYARPNEDIEAGANDEMLLHVDDLVAFLHAIDAVPAPLVGNSWGAFISLLAAIRHPEVVRNLVLEEPPVVTLFVSVPPRPSELLSLIFRRPRIALPIAKFGRTMGTVQKALRRGDDETALRAFASWGLGKESYRRLSESRMQQMRENMSALTAEPPVPSLAGAQVRNVNVATLLVTGERSPALLLRLTDRLEELLPTVERVTIPDASHLMHEENPSATNEAIIGFIRRHRHGPS